MRRWPRAYLRTRRGYARLSYHLRVPHEAEYKLFAALEGTEGLFIDVGANTGQSARSLRIYNRSLDVISFEPNPLLEPDLAFTKRLLGERFEYRIVGLGSTTGRATLAIPVLRGMPQTAWATADRAALEASRARFQEWIGGHFEIAEAPIEIARFDSLDLHPIAVKIDVEGCESEVLKGMEETVHSDEPLLMLEHSEGADEIIASLCQRGYEIYLYHRADNRLRPGRPRKTTNYFACTPGWLHRYPAVAALIDHTATPAEPAAARG
ncbi:MAG TPA: FkbM family methyltransferase [Pirellulales bacterium]|nr:FkbM family methyltransferase [Pirellulales bacterium]